ncbi:unnamed protein product, partial [Staurois parvus]
MSSVFSPWRRHGQLAVTPCGFTAGYPLQMHEKWPCNLLGPVTCPRRLWGWRGEGQLHRSGSGYLLWSSPVLCSQSLVISCTMFTVSGHLLYYVRSLWSSPVLCSQSLVISCTMTTVSGHLLYYDHSLWSSLVAYPQSLVIFCTVSAVSGHLLYYVHSLWSSPVVYQQSLVISFSISAVSGHLLYCVHSLW